MDRREFLEKLSYELAARRVENILDIMSDFDAHFEEGLRDGLTEAEIAEVLGDPAEIAEQCAGDYAYSGAKGQGDGTGGSGGENGIFIDLLGTTLVLERHNGDYFDLSFFKHGAPLDPGQIAAEYHIDRGAGFLRLSQSKQRSLADRFLSMFDFRTAVVSVPASFCGDIRARVTSGNVELRGIDRAKSLNLDVFSGNTQVSGLSCGVMSAKSRSGNIKFESCAGDLIASGFSGNVTVEAHRGSVSARSASGTVKVETDAITTSSEISTKSGNVKLDLGRLQADLILKCVSGNVTFTIHELRGNISAKTTSGNVTGYLHRDTRADIRLNSSAAKNDFSDQYYPNSGVPVVALTTRSGSVKVKKI